MEEKTALDQLRADALESRRLNNQSSEHLPGSVQYRNEAFTNPNHSHYSLASILLSFRDEFPTIVQIMTTVKEEEQIDYLDSHPESLAKLRSEVFLLIKDDSLTYEDLLTLGLHSELVTSFRTTFSKYLPATTSVSTDTEVVAAEMSCAKKRKHVEVVSPAESATSNARSMKQPDTFVFDLSDDENECAVESISKPALELPVDVYLKKLHYSNLERSMTAKSNSIYAHQSRLESLTASVAIKVEQAQSLATNRDLIEQKRALGNARILKYSELISGYRMQLNKVLSQISELERRRLSLQASLDENEVQNRNCLIAKQEDEAKLAEVDQKAAELSKAISKEEEDLANINNWLLNANRDISIKRNFLDVASLENSSLLSTPHLIELISLQSQNTVAPGAQVSFLHEYSPDFLQLESDLISLHHFWKIPAKDPEIVWKERVLSFIVEIRSSMAICQNEMEGQCKNDKTCPDLHFSDLEGNGDQLALRLVLQALDASERAEMKESVAKISTSSVDGYLTKVFKIPVVENCLKRMMEKQKEKVETDAAKFHVPAPLPPISHKFITPVLVDWSLGVLDLKSHPKRGSPEFELAKKTLKSVDDWIVLTVSTLPDRTTFTPATLKDSILILLEGLQIEDNAKSERLRSFFLDCLLAYTTNEETLVDMFESAIEDIPSSMHLRWMYYGYVKDLAKKRSLLAGIVKLAISGNSAKNSSSILTCLMQMFTIWERNEILSVSIFVIQGASEESAIPYEQSGELIRSSLTAEHFTFFTLTFVAYLSLGYIPSNIYLANENLVASSELYMLPWKEVGTLSEEASLAIDEIFQISLEHVHSRSGGKLHRRSIVTLVRNRCTFLHHCLHLGGRRLGRVLDEYINQFPFAKELIDLKALLLAECGLFNEARSVFKGNEYPESINSQIMVEVMQSGSEGALRFVQASANLLKSSKNTLNRKLFTANIQALLSIIGNESDMKSIEPWGNESAKEVLFKEHLASISYPSKVYIWSQILYLNLNGEEDISKRLEIVQKLVLDSKETHEYPFQRDGNLNRPRFHFSIDLERLCELLVSSFSEWDDILLAIASIEPELPIPMKICQKASIATQSKLHARVVQ